MLGEIGQERVARVVVARSTGALRDQRNDAPVQLLALDHKTSISVSVNASRSARSMLSGGESESTSAPAPPGNVIQPRSSRRRTMRSVRAPSPRSTPIIMPLPRTSLYLPANFDRSDASHAAPIEAERAIRSSLAIAS